MVINDNDTSTKVGVCTSRGSGGGVFRGTYNSTVDFASPIPQIDKVEYLTLGAAYLQSGTITTYLYYGGSWQKIHSRTINTHTWNPSSGWTPPTYPTPRKVTITTGGPWNNVEKVRVAVNAVSGNNYCINTYVFEVRAFGSPSPYADIGLRFFNGSKTIAIAVESNGTLTSPLRIAKDGATYGIVLVNPGEMYDSGLRIQTSSGIKALRKYS